MKEYGSESGRMPEGRMKPDHSGSKMPHGMKSAESGCMPTGRKMPDRSGEQLKSWKHNGER